MRQVIAEECTIAKIHGRVLGEASVSRTAARITLMNTLPPGFVCIECDPATDRIWRLDESGKGFLSLFIDRVTEVLSIASPRRWSSMRSMGMNIPTGTISFVGGGSIAAARCRRPRRRALPSTFCARLPKRSTRLGGCRTKQSM